MKNRLGALVLLAVWLLVGIGGGGLYGYVAYVSKSEVSEYLATNAAWAGLGFSVVVLVVTGVIIGISSTLWHSAATEDDKAAVRRAEADRQAGSLSEV